MQTTDSACQTEKHLAFENSDYKKYDDYMREHYFWKHVEEYWRAKLLSSCSVLSMKSSLQKDVQQLSAYYENNPDALMPEKNGAAGEIEKPKETK